MQYFSEFPKIVYNLKDDIFSGKFCTDITARSTFLREVKENMIIAYDYPVQESDRPEFISHKLYGDVYRNWIVLLYNNIYNPYYDYPLTRDNLHKYIINKYEYADISAAYSDVHHYEKVITKQFYFMGVLKKTVVEKHEINDKVVNYTYDSAGNETVTIETRTDLPDVANGFYSLSISAEEFSQSFDDGTSVVVSVTNDAVTVYTYEEKLNESKRTVRLVDAAYVEQIEKEFKVLMNAQNI